MFDFLVKNASLPDGREGIDLACKNGLITNVEKNISAEAKETIDAKNNLENNIYQMKSTLSDEKMSSLLDEDLNVNFDQIHRYLINGYKSLYKQNSTFYYEIKVQKTSKTTTILARCQSEKIGEVTKISGRCTQKTHFSPFPFLSLFPFLQEGGSQILRVCPP